MNIGLFLIFITFYSFSVNGQSNQMLMEQVEGKTYIKKSYDKNSKIEGSQIIKIGKILKDKNGYKLDIKMSDYDANGDDLIESYSTSYSCSPDDSEIFFTILPYSSFSANKKVFISSDEKINLYPKDWIIGAKLNSIKFTMNIKGGAVGFFSSESNIIMKNRSIVRKSEKTGNFLISGLIIVNFYSFGINIKSLKIKLSEWVHPQKGLISQRFTFEDGSYFKITLKQ